MTTADGSLTDLLDRLNRGDERAAREVFEAYGPYLRMVVRRRLSTPLRAKLDSEDIVQSVWADLVHVFREGRGHFPDARRLRAFLIRAACNRLIDRHRQFAPALLRERPMAEGQIDLIADDESGRPGGQVEADELWDQILATCPESHHDLIRLKRQGLAVAEIAERTGLHPSSVRRVLYDLARRVGVARAADRAGQPTT